jgi:hypothetical protein
MHVVKKTVALHPVMDRYVRKLQAILIEKGYNASYSTALNYMVLYQVFNVAYGKNHRKVAELLASFLDDPKTINEIVREDLLAEYLEEIRKRIGERYIA